MKNTSFVLELQKSDVGSLSKKLCGVVTFFFLAVSLVNAQTPVTISADAISAPNSIVVGDGNNPTPYLGTGHSILFGYNNIDNGSKINNSIFGISNVVSGQSTFIFGKTNTTSGNISFVVGRSNTTTKDYAMIFGRYNTSNSKSATIMGQYNNDNGEEHATIFGVENVVSAYSHWGTAIGHRNIIGGGYEAYAFGQDNKNGGNASYTIGYLNETHGHASYAIGKQNYISTAGEYADAFGRSNNINSLNGLCYGFSNYVAGSAEGAMCFGNKNNASGYVAAAFGYKNNASGGNSIAFGKENTSSGAEGSAVGYRNIASGGGSVSLGKENSASAYAAVSIGYKNAVSGIYSSAFGYTNTASGERSIVLGYKSVATGKKSGAIGFMLNNGVENSLKVGASESAYLMMIASSNPALQGYVGIGTMNPTANFHIAGSIRFEGYSSNANPTSTTNKVLTTDASGNIFLAKTYWQPHTNSSTILYNGIVAIGNAADFTSSTTLNTTSNYQLVVAGVIGAKKVKVTQSGWADYVFAENYKLQSLNEVEKFIKANKHLEGIPTEKEVKESGVDLGDTQVMLLKKIEELTLHLIDLNKKMEKQSIEIGLLKKQIRTEKL